MSILIKNAIILPMNISEGQELYYKGSIAICDNKIEFVCPQGDKRVEEFEAKADKVIDGTGKLVMPGLINTHTHVPMTLLRGFADDMPLMQWLNEKIWVFEAQLQSEDVAIGTKLGIYEMLLGGTTSFVDMYYFTDTIYDIVKQTGIRAALSYAITDFNRNTEGERDILEKHASEKCDRISIYLAPHAPYTVSPENFSYIRDLMQKHNLPINTHLAETQDEVQIIKERYDCSPTEFMDKMGMLNSRTIAAHGIYLSDNDIDILQKRGVSIAHNPQSNMKLGSGIAPVSKLLEKGVNVALGTDGVSSNNDTDMWEEMRSASFLQKVNTLNPCTMPAYELLKMATVNAAKAMGRDDLGVLKQGNIADIIMLDVQKVHLYPQHDMVANLVYCAKGSDVHTVIVDGKILVENSSIVGVDLIKELTECEQSVKSILKRLKEN